MAEYEADWRNLHRMAAVNLALTFVILVSVFSLPFPPVH
jgi:hypothetical protein